MKNTKHLLLLFLAVSVLSVTAQDKLLNFKDAIYFNRKVLPERLSNLQWMGKSVHYTYVKDNQLMKASAISDEKAQTILSADSLNALLKTFKTSINRFPNLKWEDEKSFLFKNKGMLFKFSLQQNKLQKINSWPDSAEISSVEPHSHSVAYTIANNLYIAQNNKQLQLTDDPENVVNGQTVARSEFGITGGIFWSPKGNFLAYYHKDERMVGDYPVVDIRPAEATVKMMKYPMTGSQNEVVQLAVYDRNKDTTIYLKTAKDTDQFLTNISWDPSEKYIYIAVLNRDQNHLKLNKYDAQSGDFVQTLFEESAPSWVEPEHPLTFMKNRDDEFIWYSKREYTSRLSV
jgi:dipeptidyl-peptidase-4